MSRIYKQATSVAVWLGPEADESSRAMSFLKTAAKVFDKPRRMQNLISNPQYWDDVLALVSVFERPYWERLWPRLLLQLSGGAVWRCIPT